jgi:hypothetical protein
MSRRRPTVPRERVPSTFPRERFSSPAGDTAPPVRGQRLHHDRADLGLQPPTDHHHAASIRIHVQGAVAVAARRLLRFGFAVHPSPAADDDLHMLRSAGPANREQSLFGLWSGHPRQRADLGVRQLAARKRLRQSRQRPQCPRHADVLARGTGLEPDAPGQPRSARAKAIAPAAAGIELANEIEQPRSGGVEMGGQLGDLITEALQVSVHRRFSSVHLRRLYTAVFEASGRRQEARSRSDPVFSRDGSP